MTGLFMSTTVFLQVAPTAFAQVGWKYYLLFVCITAVMIVTIWLYFPEVRINSFLSEKLISSLLGLKDERTVSGRYWRSFR